MKSIKKLLAVLMITALIVSCFAINASAQPTCDVYVGGVEVIGTNANITSDYITGKVSYDADKKILTLDNATIDASDKSYSVGIGISVETTILVKGDCTIITDDDSAIYADPNAKTPTTIKGDGDDASLTIKTENPAISLQSDLGLIIENVNISITCENGSNYAGMIAQGPITIKDSTIKIDKVGTGMYTVYANHPDYPEDSGITINNSNIDITDNVDGIVVLGNSDQNDLEIKYSTIKINDEGIAPNTDTGDRNCTRVATCGLHSDTSIDLRYSKLDITSKNTNAIYAVGRVEILECSGTLVSNATSKNERAINADTVEIDEKTVVTAGKTEAAATVIRPTADTKWVDYMYVNLDRLYPYTGDNTWTKGTTNGAEIKSEAPFVLFDYVTVDGKTVDSANYTAKDGSTIITFKSAYLETLSVGDHEVVVYSLSGSAKGTLTIKEVTPTPEPAPAAEPEAVADTADTNVVAGFAALAALSAAGFVTIKKKEN